MPQPQMPVGGFTIEIEVRISVYPCEGGYEARVDEFPDAGRATGPTPLQAANKMEGMLDDWWRG